MTTLKNYFGQSVESVASELATNPKYDAGWVDEVSHILSEYEGYYEHDFNIFSAEQVSLIYQALKLHSDDKEFMDLLMDRHLNITQMQIVLSAKTKGVKNEWLDKLANGALHYSKGNYISQGMVDGFNMFDIIDPYEYDADQVYEIFAGIKSGVDYKKYLDKDISSELMGIIRHALQLGLDISVDVRNDDFRLVIK